MSKFINYFLAVSLGFILGSYFGMSKMPKEVVCESGMEVESRYKTGGRVLEFNEGYSLWSSVCNFDTVTGREITVTMID